MLFSAFGRGKLLFSNLEFSSFGWQTGKFSILAKFFRHLAEKWIFRQIAEIFSSKCSPTKKPYFWGNYPLHFIIRLDAFSLQFWGRKMVREKMNWLFQLASETETRFLPFFLSFWWINFLVWEQCSFRCIFFARSVGIIFVPYFWMLSDVFSFLYNWSFTFPNLLSHK